MPAHTDEGSIGQVVTSTGELVSENMWCANQMVDLLAKDGALAVRYSSRQRAWFRHWEKQLQELVIFLGKLTCVANAFSQSDGSVSRDSDAVKSKRKSKKRAQSSVCKLAAKPAKLARSRNWVGPGPSSRKSRSSQVAGGVASVSACRVSEKLCAMHAQSCITERQEAAFQKCWRESRSQSLQPRSADAPTAQERLDALRQRVAARAGASL